MWDQNELYVRDAHCYFMWRHVMMHVLPTLCVVVLVTEIKYDKVSAIHHYNCLKLCKAWPHNYHIVLDRTRWQLAAAADNDAHSWRSWTCRCRLASGGLASWSGVDVSSAVQNWPSLSGQGISCRLLSVSQWCHLEKDTFVCHIRKYGMWIILCLSLTIHILHTYWT